jgi:hypothetical protein
VLELVVASGICGLLLGWHCKVYVALPMVFVLLGFAYFLGQADGLTRGILAFVFSLVAMQLCFLISGIIQVFLDNFEPQKARDRATYGCCLSQDMAELGLRQGYQPTAAMRRTGWVLSEDQVTILSFCSTL